MTKAHLSRNQLRDKLEPLGSGIILFHQLESNAGHHQTSLYIPLHTQGECRCQMHPECEFSIMKGVRRQAYTHGINMVLAHARFAHDLQSMPGDYKDLDKWYYCRGCFATCRSPAAFRRDHGRGSTIPECGDLTTRMGDVVCFLYESQTPCLHPPSPAGEVTISTSDDSSSSPPLPQDWNVEFLPPPGMFEALLLPSAESPDSSPGLHLTRTWMSIESPECLLTSANFPLNTHSAANSEFAARDRLPSDHLYGQPSPPIPSPSNPPATVTNSGQSQDGSPPVLHPAGTNEVDILRSAPLLSSVSGGMDQQYGTLSPSPPASPGQHPLPAISYCTLAQESPVSPIPPLHTGRGGIGGGGCPLVPRPTSLFHK